MQTVMKAGLGVIQLISCSTQLGMNVIMHMNVKMTAIVDILTIISVINTTSDSLKIFTILAFVSIWNCVLS